MSYEKAVYERLICDACGVCVLESPDVMREARKFDWMITGGDHLCPTCSPSPSSDYLNHHLARIDRAEALIKSQYAAIQRVREVHQAVVDDDDDPWQVTYAAGWDEALKQVRRALDGEK